MHLENIKFWHWTIIGLLVGVLFGGIKLMQGPSFDVEGLETLDQPTFDREVAGMQTTTPRHDRQLIQQHHAGQPMLKDLVLHGQVPDEPTHSYWVTGKFFRISVDHQKKGDNSSPIVAIGEWVIQYCALVPYVSTVTLPGHYPTVVDFLAAVEKKYPKGAVPYRFAWYEQTKPTMLQLPLAGVLIIGIAWPLTLMLMQGAGLARTPQAKLPRQRQLSPTAKAPKDHSADDKKLADLNAQMDKALAGFGSSAPASEDSAVVAGGPAPVKALGGADVTPATPPPTQEEIERKYGGEFYPVVKETHKKKKMTSHFPRPD